MILDDFLTGDALFTQSKRGDDGAEMDEKSKNVLLLEYDTDPAQKVAL
jgi:hypothetical protein